MAARIHFNPQSGKIGACRALISCPFGEARHFTTVQEAASAYEAQMAKLLDYQDFYALYNFPLREGRPMREVEGAEELADLLWSMGPQKDHPRLYRGVDTEGKSWAGVLSVGQKLTDLGFFSTSSNPGVAAWFATGEDDSCGTVFEILNAQAMPCAPMAPYENKLMESFGLQGEDEYLLPPGLTFEVKEITTTEWDDETYRLVRVAAERSI